MGCGASSRKEFRIIKITAKKSLLARISFKFTPMRQPQVVSEQLVKQQYLIYMYFANNVEILPLKQLN